MINLLHCADLHMDSPFSGLEPEQAAERRREQRQLPGSIADLSNHLGCQLLLCSGDLFDSAAVCPETIEALRDAFAACKASVFVAPGNHDPWGPHSPWASVRWPENVHIFKGAQECVTLEELGCRVWGAGFTSPECYDPLEPVGESGLVEIGVFHGDPTAPGPYRYLTKEAIAGSGLDYLALGHIHKIGFPEKIGGTWVGWPGIPMGRGFDETGVHGVFHVQVDQSSCKAELLPLQAPRYEKWTVEAGSQLTRPEDSKDWICRLTVTGESEPIDLAALQRQLAPQFYALELRDETVPPLDLWEDCGADTLRGQALAFLKRHYDAPEERQTAALAARYLLAALEGREEP